MHLADLLVVARSIFGLTTGSRRALKDLHRESRCTWFLPLMASVDTHWRSKSLIGRSLSIKYSHIYGIYLKMPFRNALFNGFHTILALTFNLAPSALLAPAESSIPLTRIRRGSVDHCKDCKDVTTDSGNIFTASSF